MKNYFKKGITAVELLVVIVVLGIIFSVALSQFSKFRENQVLKTAVNDVLSSLNKARSQTLSSLNSSEYGVHFQSDRVIIFKGAVFSAEDPDNETISILAPAAIFDVTLNGVGG